MEKLKNNFKSVRFKLFFIMCIIIAVIVLCLVAINSVVLESFYLYSKTKTVRNVYTKINNYYNMNGNDENLQEELRRIAFNNNFDIFNSKGEIIMEKIKIGNFISECRKKKKLTQEQLAEKMDVSVNAVSKWERGLNLPDISKMPELCNILEITINELLEGKKLNENEFVFFYGLKKIPSKARNSIISRFSRLIKK